MRSSSPEVTVAWLLRRLVKDDVTYGFANSNTPRPHVLIAHTLLQQRGYEWLNPSQHSIQRSLWLSLNQGSSASFAF